MLEKSSPRAALAPGVSESRKAKGEYHWSVQFINEFSTRWEPGGGGGGGGVGGGGGLT